MTVVGMAGVRVGVAAGLVSSGTCCVGTGVSVTGARAVEVGPMAGSGVTPITGVPTGVFGGLGVGRGADVAVGMGVDGTVGTGVMVRVGTGTPSVNGGVGVGVSEVAGMGVGTVGRVARGSSTSWGTATGRPDTSGTSTVKPAGVGVGSDPLQAAINTKMRKTVVTKILTDVQEPKWGKVSPGNFVLPQSPPRSLGPCRPVGRPDTGGARGRG